MKRATILVTAAALLALAGCGRKEDLRPANGARLPPKAATAATQPTATQLLAPTQMERPMRSDEVLLKSQERPVDRFNLPPPD